MLGGQHIGSFSRYLDLPGASRSAGKSTLAVEKRDLVFLEQVKNTVVVLFDDLVLALEHLADVDRQTLDMDTVVGKGVTGLFVIFRGLQQRFRRNAADIGAGAARCGLAVRRAPLVDAGDLHAELGSADGCNVTAGTGADYDYVEVFSHFSGTICD